MDWMRRMCRVIRLGRGRRLLVLGRLGREILVRLGSRGLIVGRAPRPHSAAWPPITPPNKASKVTNKPNLNNNKPNKRNIWTWSSKRKSVASPQVNREERIEIRWWRIVNNKFTPTTSQPLAPSAQLAVLDLLWVCKSLAPRATAQKHTTLNTTREPIPWWNSQLMLQK